MQLERLRLLLLGLASLVLGAGGLWMLLSGTGWHDTIWGAVGVLFFGLGGVALLRLAMKDGASLKRHIRAPTRIQPFIIPAVLLFTLPWSLKLWFCLPLLAAWALLFPRYEDKRALHRGLRARSRHRGRPGRPVRSGPRQRVGPAGGTPQARAATRLHWRAAAARLSGAVGGAQAPAPICCARGNHPTLNTTTEAIVCRRSRRPGCLRPPRAPLPGRCRAPARRAAPRRCGWPALQRCLRAPPRPPPGRRRRRLRVRGR